ncbi:hypothetical protein [Methanolobus sp. ZRKC5]|uniref:HEAT repeat domain-containing protein n=1 Tax=unclassified Methanolobus TaxID=2629569 RepID=UPI00313C6C54
MINQEEIHNQCLSKDSKVRIKALNNLKHNFSLLPDKQKAWDNIVTLTSDKNSHVNRLATSFLGSLFSQIQDKKQAWNDLRRLFNYKDANIRYKATEVLGLVFSQIPDKQEAWEELRRLINDKNRNVRAKATKVLGLIFSQIPDKQQAWEELDGRFSDRDSHVRVWATHTLGLVFFQVPDKHEAWGDLHWSTNDNDSYVRWHSISAIKSAFFHIPYKQQAWSDLIKLTTDEDRNVRSKATDALGSVYCNISDDQQAWSDLHGLTNSEYKSVRIYANCSLGKASIYKASQAKKEEDYKLELEKAISFFEKSAQETVSWTNNPSQFCLPFYLSFHTIIFEKQNAENEVERHLIQARNSIKGSKSKELLIEAVNNLSNALKEVHNLESMDLELMKDELNFYRKHCESAVELMRDTEKTAPYATATMRKGLPLLDRYLKELIDEIKKRSKGACKESKGTDAEEIVCEISTKIQNVISDEQRQYIEILEDIVSILRIKIPPISENEFLLNKIQAIDNKDIAAEKYRDLPLIISIIPNMKVVSEKELNRKLLKLDLIYEKTVSIETKLDLLQNELRRGLEKLDILSLEVGGKEGEFIQTFSRKIIELTENKDKEALKNFLEEILKNEDTLIEEIEKFSTSQEEKKESKSCILKISSVLDKIKHPIKSFGKDVTNEIIVSFAAEEIVKLFFQLMSMATLGIPIPPQILNLLTSITKEFKN